MNYKIKLTIITLLGIFIVWLGTMIGYKIQSDVLTALSWFFTFIVGYKLGKKFENLKWKGLLK